jgi:hypothetical protein
LAQKILAGQVSFLELVIDSTCFILMMVHVEYVKEIETFMNSTKVDAGVQIFQWVEEKILSEMPNIGLFTSNSSSSSSESSKSLATIRNNKTWMMDYRHEHEDYDGVDESKIYVYLASDNEIVKEAFANYFLNHANIRIMRIKNIGQIVSRGLSCSSCRRI